MKRVFLATLLLLTVVTCTRQHQSSALIPAQAVVDSLASALTGRPSQEGDLINIPDEIESPIAIGQEQLERSVFFKLSVRDIWAFRQGDRLTTILKSLKVSPSSELMDLRWGIVLYAEKDVRLGAIYVDRFGRGGAINEFTVSFDKELYHWFRDVGRGFH
ncbi:MAG: hypothetical protein HY851_00710 [candidate division Zixibacteria bacterium]|nr:hypothetical protein [candidate division Zixibacteria bacterium]